MARISRQLTSPVRPSVSGSRTGACCGRLTNGSVPGGSGGASGADTDSGTTPNRHPVCVTVRCDLPLAAVDAPQRPRGIVQHRQIPGVKTEWVQSRSTPHEIVFQQVRVWVWARACRSIFQCSISCWNNGLFINKTTKTLAPGEMKITSKEKEEKCERK